MKKPISRRARLFVMAATVAVGVCVAWAVARNREAARQDAARRAQIQSDVPAPSDFGRLLKRDVALFLRQSSGSAADVGVEVLNKEPILSAAGQLRFYAWARFWRGKKLAGEGVACASAVGRTRFVVTSYLSRAALSRDARSLDALPEEVRAAVRSRLR